MTGVTLHGVDTPMNGKKKGWELGLRRKLSLSLTVPFVSLRKERKGFIK